MTTGGVLSVELEFECTEQVVDTVLGFSVFSAEGPRLFQCLSVHDGPAISNLCPGRYRATATIESNPLLPGHYVLDVGARCANKSLDWIQDLLHFEVVDQPTVGVDYHLPTSGFVYIPSRWDGPIMDDNFRRT
jgi:hypothetical protein